MIDFTPLKGLEEPSPPSYSRPYLGMSAVGQECDRKTLLSWRWVTKTSHDARIQRIFDLGHNLEQVIIDSIRNMTDVRLKYVGTDQLEIIGPYGHWRGHPDGILEDDQSGTYMIEIKTHKDDLFKKLKKSGVQGGHPSHYDQMQVYMGSMNMPDECVYIAINKDTCEFYCEIIEVDFDRINSLKERMEHIVTTDSLPPRIGNNKPNFYKCKMCEYSDVCFEKEPLDINCRTCKYFAVKPDGVFGCIKHKIESLDLSSQEKGCADHQLDAEYFKL